LFLPLQTRHSLLFPSFLFLSFISDQKLGFLDMRCIDVALLPDGGVDGSGIEKHEFTLKGTKRGFVTLSLRLEGDAGRFNHACCCQSVLAF
jgi:hypothetical protein